MRVGIDALSDKEKETLRLIVRGHDAKSAARELGLSVHTVNERLRDARRKLDVTSSREAARQLFENEGASHNSLGYRPLGDAAQLAAVQPVFQPAQGRGILRRTGWVLGGFAMSISLALLALSALSGPGQTPTHSPRSAPAVSPTPASEAAAIDAATQFLAMVDRDDWVGSWQATHKSFQLLNTVEWWAENSLKVRGEMGTIRSRELATVNFTKAPPDGYWEISFSASYSKKGSVIETVSLASEGGGWKVAGIAIE